VVLHRKPTPKVNSGRLKTSRLGLHYQEATGMNGSLPGCSIELLRTNMKGDTSWDKIASFGSFEQRNDFVDAAAIFCR
jgi:hypothetical protein